MAPRHQLKITKDRRARDGWLRFTVRGTAVRGQAKMTDSPESEPGINGGRVFKLFVSEKRRSPEQTFNAPVYEYDRGSCLDATTAAEQALVASIVSQLNGLPPATPTKS